MKQQLFRAYLQNLPQFAGINAMMIGFSIKAVLLPT
jgi:hypothetical protein